MATHSSVLAWRIQGMKEPGGLLCMGSHRVGHDWSDLAAAAAADSIFKSRDITLPTKVHLVKAMFFPLVMYGCESWTIKKAERQRIDLSSYPSSNFFLSWLGGEGHKLKTCYWKQWKTNSWDEALESDHLLVRWQQGFYCCGKRAGSLAMLSHHDT